jgi:hypothetical protein
MAKNSGNGRNLRSDRRQQIQGRLQDPMSQGRFPQGALNLRQRSDTDSRRAITASAAIEYTTAGLAGDAIKIKRLTHYGVGGVGSTDSSTSLHDALTGLKAKSFDRKRICTDGNGAASVFLLDQDEKVCGMVAYQIVQHKIDDWMAFKL